MKIICIGRNYTEHIAELKNERPTEPVIFLKPQTSLLAHGRPFYYPDFSKDIHYEAELVYKIIRNGKFIPAKHAPDYYDAISVGIDFTARDVQEKQKQKGLPWEIAKAFDGSAAIGNFIPLSEAKDNENEISFSLFRNNEMVQHGITQKMLWDINEIIVYVSRFFTLNVGDYIFTGTPAGVGPIQIDDHFVGKIKDKILLDFWVK